MNVIFENDFLFILALLLSKTPDAVKKDITSVLKLVTDTFWCPDLTSVYLVNLTYA